jgi:hypothetical protein
LSSKIAFTITTNAKDSQVLYLGVKVVFGLYGAPERIQKRVVHIQYLAAFAADKVVVEALAE